MSGPVSTRLAGVERRLATISADVALAAAQAVADGVSAQVAADGPLSNYRGGGAIRVEGRPDGPTSAVTVPTSGAGQLAIMSTGAKAHLEGRRGEYLALADGGFVEGQVRHPGARGRNTWARGVTRGTPAARRAAAKVFQGVTRG